MPRSEKSASIATIGDLIDGGYWLIVCCNSTGRPCHNYGEIDLPALAARFGRAYPCDHWSLCRMRWLCTKCGSRRVSFRLSPASKAPSSFAATDDDPEF